MKKVMLFALSCAFLTACSAEKVTDPNELSPGLMQPVEGSGATNGSFSWSDFQTAPMPDSMKATTK